MGFNTLEGEKSNETFALNCEKSGNGIPEMSETFQPDKTNCEEINDFQQTETINHRGGSNIIDQVPNASAQSINQQTENLDCEHCTRESYSTTQTIDAPTLRQRQVPSIHVSQKSTKSTNNATCTSTGRSFSLNSAGEGSSRGTKGTPPSNKSKDTSTTNGGSEYECNIW